MSLRGPVMPPLPAFPSASHHVPPVPHFLPGPIAGLQDPIAMGNKGQTNCRFRREGLTIPKRKDRQKRSLAEEKQEPSSQLSATGGLLA